MRLAVVTVCSDASHPGLARLGRSCAKWGFDLHPVIRPWWPHGFWTKPLGVREYLPVLRRAGVTHVLATDAYDVVACGPPCDVEPHVRSGCLFSADKAPWPPVPGLEAKYPPRESPWWFVNSGGYGGPLDFLGDYVLAGDPPLGPEWTGGGEHDCHRNDDQLWMARKYIGCPGRDTPAGCRIDRGCGVFQTTGHSHAPDWGPEFHRDATFEVRGDRVVNKKTGTAPVFVHGNGGDWDKMAWLPGGEL